MLFEIALTWFVQASLHLVRIMLVVCSFTRFLLSIVYIRFHAASSASLHWGINGVSSHVAAEGFRFGGCHLFCVHSATVYVLLLPLRQVIGLGRLEIVGLNRIHCKCPHTQCPCSMCIQHLFVHVFMFAQILAYM